MKRYSLRCAPLKGASHNKINHSTQAPYGSRAIELKTQGNAYRQTSRLDQTIIRTTNVKAVLPHGGNVFVMSTCNPFGCYKQECIADMPIIITAQKRSADNGPVSLGKI